MMARLLPCVAAFLACLGSAPASAQIYEVVLQTQLDEFFNGDVFGVTGPADIELRFFVDSQDPGAVLMPAATGLGWESDLHGFPKEAISGLDFVFGTAIATEDDLDTQTPEAGFTTSVWFDEPLADGISPDIWMSIALLDGTATFGNGACGTPCALGEAASVEDDEASSSASSDTLDVTVRLAACTAEPRPSCVALEKAKLSCRRRSPATRS